jgi:hypothetical protein
MTARILTAVALILASLGVILSTAVAGAQTNDTGASDAVDESAGFVAVVEAGGLLHVSGQLPFRDGKVVTFLAFDGSRTYGPDGVLPPSAADKQWAENFGFGVIRFALDQGFSLARQPDDLVDGQPVYRIEVTDPTGAKTLFGISRADYAVLSVGFATPRGWHERIYSNFYQKPGLSWVQPGRIRLYYNGVKQNEIVWRDFKLNEAMPDGLFTGP